MRAYRCRFYDECLHRAAVDDLEDIPGCPCGRFEPEDYMPFETMLALQKLARLVVARGWPEHLSG